ncbi:hypothetical protein GCM10027269_40220 [Kribbella endophytica]
MIEGWERQQRVRFLKADTLRRRRRMVERLVEFSGLYPWQWTAAEVEAFVDHMRSGSAPIVASTARNYLVDLRVFLEYVTDPRYGWAEVCIERFGQAASASPERVEHHRPRQRIRRFAGAPAFDV